ncbi:MAG: M6 family metalloprotease domain-containing protein, partial [candidate division Zixibacteria bacterium]|nr:M6 family metalloprotease domain-containing protein [candidate division Zixibacteria bacterium]
PDVVTIGNSETDGLPKKLGSNNPDNGLNAPSKLLKLANSEFTGTFNALAVLIDFSDKPNLVDPFDFDTLLFVNQQGSLRHYYSEVSYGQLDVITVNLPSATDWITAPQTYAYYCNNQNGTGSYPQNSQKLCEDIVDLIDPLIDFSQYDNNGNGYVDAIILIHTGPGAELFGSDSTNYIWSHKWSISPRSKDGVAISEYTIQPEYWFSPGDITCGVFCHELGHVFGLPDLYDRDNSSNGIGRWSLMSYGSWLGPSNLGGVPAGLDAWSRIELGFKNYTNVTSNANNIGIANIEEGGPIFRFWSSGNIGSEYFLVENRQKIGYDTYLPSDGLLIWHIDETKAGTFNSNNDDEWYPGHISSGNYLVALEQSDGLFEIDKDISKGNNSDPFPGTDIITEFSPSTTPGSNNYNGDNTYVSIENISVSGSTMTADFNVSLLSDINDDFAITLPSSFSLRQNYPNPFNPKTSIEIELTAQSSVTLNIYDILGRLIATPLEEHLLSGKHKIEWNCQNETNEELSTGIYFYQLITDFGTETKTMLLLK